MKSTPFSIALALALASCSDNSSSQDDNFINVDETLVAPVATPKPPPHNYDFKEDAVYGYIAGVSEEDQKKGKAAGDVHMFTYHGNEDGTHKLRAVDANGQEEGRFECSTPCVAIKAYFGNSVTRIAYNPTSVIGSAFEDAINGHLKPVKKAAPATVTRSGLAAYNGKYPFDAVNGVKFVDRPEVIRAVRSAVSDPSILKWVLMSDATAGPIDIDGDRVLMWACEPHNCGPRNWTVLLRQSSGEAAVCFHDEERGTSQWYRSGEPVEQASECPHELS